MERCKKIVEKVKKIVATIVFLGIGVVLFIGVSYMLRPIDKVTTGNVFYREGFPGFYAEEDNTLDIVAFGASGLSHFLYNSVLWEETGLTSYNMGTSNQSTYVLEQLIDEVKKTQNPQLIIIESRKFIYEEDKYTNQNSFKYIINNLNYSWERIQMIDYLIEDNWEERFQYYFDIYTYHDSWENFTYENIDFADNAVRNFTMGWKTINKIRKVKMQREMLPVTQENELPISPDTEKVLRSLLEKCKRENIQVLFVATPFRIGEEGQRKNMYLGRIIEEEGFKFLDANQYVEEIGLDGNQDFWDKRHTNVFGAEKFTRFLAGYLEENFDLIPQKDPELVAYWTQVLQENQAYAEELKSTIKEVKN